MTSCSFNIVGMDCATCAEKIKKHLSSIDGVQKVDVFLSTSTVRITFNRKKITRSQIVKKIANLGYKVTLEEKTIPAKYHFFSKHLSLFLIILSSLFIIIGYIKPNGIYTIKFNGVFDLIAVVIGGVPLLYQAFKDLKNRTITAEVFMTIGVLASVATGELKSAALIALFMLISDFLDSFTMNKSRQAVKELIESAPKTANVKKDEVVKEVPISEVKKDDIIIVKSGEKIPVEGIVVDGHGIVNQSIITGEPVPVEKKVGDTVYAATINELGILLVRVGNVGDDTAYGRIIKLIQEAESSKAPVQKIADNFAKYFTPAIIFLAVATYLFSHNLKNAIAVIVVSCPCAIAIATPLAFIAGIGKAAKNGIIIKGGKYLESLAKIDTIVMDKTGTLTIGDPNVTEVKSYNNFTVQEVITYAAAAERYSEHPLAKAILKMAYNVAYIEPKDYKIIPGLGISMTIYGKKVLLGSKETLKTMKIEYPDSLTRYIETLEEKGETVLVLLVDNKLAGTISVFDTLKEGTKEVMDEFGKLNIQNTIILTGDNEKAAKTIAETLKIKHFFANLKPEDKVGIIKGLMKKGRKVLMIGDGINDAPALAQANVGIALGALGADLAIETADVVIMNDDWNQIPQAIKISRKTTKIIKENLALSITFNVIGIFLSAIGFLSPSLAAIAHIVPDVLVFINTSRIIR